MTANTKNYILLVIATITGVLTSYFVYDATKSFVAYLFIGIGLPLIVFLVASFFTKEETDKNETEDDMSTDADTTTDVEATDEE